MANSLNSSILDVAGLSVSYGSSHALSGVSVSIEEGAALAVVGVNGAGKSSLARAISGLVRPTAGTITFAGRGIVGVSPDQVRKMGIAYLPEERGIATTLTVDENLRIAVRWVKSRSERADGVAHVIDMFPVLAERRDRRAGTLSGGEQQMLSLARALAVWPKLLIADELSLGLAPLIVDEVFDRLTEARKHGVTVLLIEQFVHRALAFADRVVVLRAGELAWSGPTATVTSEEILHRYLGEEVVHAQ